MKKLLLIATLAACTGDLPEPYDLNHNRIIAVRANPPGVVSGDRSELDALLVDDAGHTREAPPEAAIVVSPMSLESVLAMDNGHWYVTAPDEATLVAAREELMLDAGAPVPIEVGVSYQGMDKLALKTVVLGEARTNPPIDTATIDGMPLSAQTMLTVDAAAETHFAVDAVDVDKVNWLSGAGKMHDFDEPMSYLTVDTDDMLDGEFALVFRDNLGGVTWRVWPIHAEGTPRKPL